jgi:hypothetical protein
MSAADDDKQQQKDEVDYTEEDEDDIDVPEYTTDEPAPKGPVEPVPPVQPLSDRQRRRQRKAQVQERAAIKYRKGGQGPPALRGRLGPLGGTSTALTGRLGPLGCGTGHFASECSQRAPPGPPPGPPVAAPFPSGVGTDRASIVQTLHHLLSLGYALGQPEQPPPHFHAG